MRFSSGFFCAVLGVAILMLPSCGFTPLYGAKSSHSQSQAARAGYDVDISVIPNREGQVLRNLLIDRLYQRGYPQNPRYYLLVAPLAETHQSLAIAKTSESTRGQLKIATRVELQDRSTNRVLFVRDLSSIGSYNILVSEFATRVTEDNARQNALNDLARQIELNISLYFKGH